MVGPHSAMTLTAQPLRLGLISLAPSAVLLLQTLLLPSRLRRVRIAVFDEYAVHCARAIDAEKIGVLGVNRIRTVCERVADLRLFMKTVFDDEIIARLQNGVDGAESIAKVTMKILHQKTRPLEFTGRVRRFFKPPLAIGLDKLDPRVGNLSDVFVHRYDLRRQAERRAQIGKKQRRSADAGAQFDDGTRPQFFDKHLVDRKIVYRLETGDATPAKHMAHTLAVQILAKAKLGPADGLPRKFGKQPLPPRP